jgi:uncharacterized protein (DUF427 family)
MRAVWNGMAVAESDDTIVIEGNHYFPPQSVRWDLLRDSAKQTVCPWKGTAGYLTIAAEDEYQPDAAWYYAEPSAAAGAIRGYVAFGRSVSVTP